VPLLASLKKSWLWFVVKVSYIYIYIYTERERERERERESYLIAGTTKFFSWIFLA